MVAIIVVLILILAILFARTRPRMRHLKMNSHFRVAQALRA
jgi:heme A synthase